MKQFESFLNSSFFISKRESGPWGGKWDCMGTEHGGNGKIGMHAQYSNE